ncbi:MAG TPA: hypothetical protein V6D08_09545 [Candidatus Obscuribacterales bacterium]
MIKVTCRSVEAATRNDRPCVEIRCVFHRQQEERKVIKAQGGLSIEKLAGVLKGKVELPGLEVPNAPVRVSLEDGSVVGIADDRGVTRYSAGFEVIHLYFFDTSTDRAWLVGKTLELDTAST